jgi:flavin reductase (DIM6/NTAB) family NADH-FMN oxidoreductase RutF
MSRPEVNNALARIATNVAVLTTGSLADARGVTANVWGEGYDPPMVLITLKLTGGFRTELAHNTSFVANVLGASQRDLAVHFAQRSDAPGEKFAGVDIRPTAAGSPRLLYCHAWFSCEVADISPFGSYEIVTGSVVESGLGAEETPLLFHGGKFKVPTEGTP